MAILTTGNQQLFLESRIFEPAIRGWNRLEGRPRAVEFDRSLGDATDFPQTLPLETVVEREPVPADLATHRQILRAVTLALEAEGLNPTTRRAVLAAYRAAYPLDTARLAGAFDGETRRLLLFEGSHLFDGLLFIADIPVGHDAKVDADFGLPPADAAAVKHAARVVEAWFAGLYSVPDAATPSTWSDPQLEYQFACETAPLDGTAETLLAPSYAQGHLEWYAFDLAQSGDTDGPGAPMPACPIHATGSLRIAMSSSPKSPRRPPTWPSSCSWSSRSPLRTIGA